MVSSDGRTQPPETPDEALSLEWFDDRATRTPNLAAGRATPGPRLEPAPGDEALLAQHLRPLFQGDRFGRKPVLVAGWLVGLPVPLLLMWAPTWGWVVAANMLLGVNQGWRGRSRSS